ncbi:MAG: hypothetical protein EHM19_04395 [Candidatus Latescibacterota bacterium]|nr:MAG: hypothetical protein EHM19_04395 [Candidatus Latescibacterota bacterium]
MRSYRSGAARAAYPAVAFLAATGAIVSAACAILLFASAGARAEEPATLHVFHVAEAGLSVPESVLRDPEADVYLVSNINGAPDARDGNGFVSRLSPDGKVLALKWIEGGAGTTLLDAPKGMAIAGGELYVSDITNVRVFDRKSGAPIASIPIPGAVFLNDVCACGDGSVYVTDWKNPAVYRILPDRSFRAIAAGEALGNPNGIACDGNDLFVADTGGKRLYSIDKGGKPVRERPTPVGGLDGLVRLADGSFLVSSWDASAVYRLAADGKAEVVASGIQSPADIGFDEKRGLLLVPVFLGDEVLAIRLGKP